LTASTVRRADVSVFLGDRVQIDPGAIPIAGVPDIAVEMLSPSEAAIDVNRKVHQYLDAGCREIWLFDADNGDVFVHSAQGIHQLRDHQALESPLLPGFSVSVSELLRIGRLRSREIEKV